MSYLFALLEELQSLGYKYGAILLVDDAHGFGMLGKDSNYSGNGSGIARHLNIMHDNDLYIAGCAKNMAAALLFACVPEKLKRTLLAFSQPLNYSQQPTPFTFGLFESGIDLLEFEGDMIKREIYSKIQRLIDGLKEIGFETFSKNCLPIVTVKINNTDTLIKFSKKPYDKHGIYITPYPYPTMAKGNERIRITVTAHNYLEQIDYLTSVFSENKEALLSSVN